jgi:HEAT repeat protein
MVMKRTRVMQIALIVFVGMGCIAGMLLGLWRMYKVPRFALTGDSPAIELTLAPGEAVVFTLPKDRELAVWNKKAGRLDHLLPMEAVSMGYGEKPFRQLDNFEEIKLPNGGTTRGESLSYIRPGAVMDGGMGKPREYILFVDDYRINIKQTQLQPVMRLRVTMEIASDDEKVGAKGEIDHFLAYLKSEDSATRSKGVASLSELLICGSTYAELREAEIVEALQSLVNDPDQTVRDQAAAKLCEAGEPVSILNELETRVRAADTDAKAAWSLGRGMRYPKKTGNLEAVYRRAVELAASPQESERVLGVAFLSGCPEHASAGPAIRRALSDPSASVRKAAANGLEQVFGNDRVAAREQSVSMLTDASPEVLIGVLESSIYVGEERQLPFGVVEPFLDHENRRLRIAAIRALRFAKGPAFEQRLLPFTHEPDAEIRAEAAQTLAHGILPETTQRFVELLDDPEVLVRIRGVQGLSSGRSLRRPDAIHERLRKETDSNVIRVAKTALKEAE